eukprot:1140596-Pelagomonas_calceolata.AAC.2
MVRRWTAKSPKQATPRPRTQLGHPQNYPGEVCWLELLRGPEMTWLGESKTTKGLLSIFARCIPGHQNLAAPTKRADGRLAGSVQELPAKLVANVSIAPATASHGPPTLQGCLNFLFGRLAKFQSGGCAG